MLEKEPEKRTIITKIKEEWGNLSNFESK